MSFSISEILLAQYKKCTKNKGPFIVGVDGLGGAGKTTFVKKLKGELKDKGHDVITIHLDDHIVESNNRYKTGYEEWHEYYYLQWDIRLLQTELFQTLSNGKTLIELPLYDNTSDTISIKSVNISPTSIVIMEGVFIQRKEWRDYFNFVIFIDRTDSVRKERVLNRDQYIGNYHNRLSKYQRRYWIAEEKYIEMVDPKEKADVIYNSMNKNY